MWLFQFPLTFHQTENGILHFIMQLYIMLDYSHADRDGLSYNLRDAPWEHIFKPGTSAAASEFCGSGFRLELMYISLILNIRSSLTHLHGFQLLVLLP